MSNKYYEVTRILDHPERLALWHDLPADKWFWLKDDYLHGQTESIDYATKELAETAFNNSCIVWQIK